MAKPFFESLLFIHTAKVPFRLFDTNFVFVNQSNTRQFLYKNIRSDIRKFHKRSSVYWLVGITKSVYIFILS